ncbi:DUF6624 domain-containing protein [Nonomuraea jiangxiensis]|uniref:Lipoprotein n=1 Tax=Nonomuraea jiangxiensis TaxID=633440 RepID=A0A1G9I828_9ACTN|nr:DUF6624 domain-containing protein [Nonomuraea jiangxiensis]SDL21215.1 hypothetical protein SAMN05421869_123105 [Nonomuraea jiangxiensis]
MRGLFASLSLLAAVMLITGCGEDAPADPALRAELLTMMERDQQVRAPGADPDRMAGVDRANTERMRRILDTHGWPGHALVGEDGAHAAWVMVQHADLDPEFQRRGLALMRQAVAKDDADPGDLAYLTDRVRVAEKKPQVYGTQWGVDAEGTWQPRTPIENEAEVDERRAEAGLQPLRDYLKELQSMQ